MTAEGPASIKVHLWALRFNSSSAPVLTCLGASGAPRHWGSHKRQGLAHLGIARTVLIPVSTSLGSAL